MKTVRFILLVSLLAGILSVSMANRHCACGSLCKANNFRDRAKIGVCMCNCDKFRQRRMKGHQNFVLFPRKEGKDIETENRTLWNSSFSEFLSRSQKSNKRRAYFSRIVVREKFGFWNDSF
ncbi:hypothetical protein CEXT_736051 [Caerostris extrusa]|uniref:Secreted protein n=1 Tax=Caerostris extrusa TaxID=172846 RepID=A0AAV4TLJ7_CAEEX|nr:hypothetical protein CEXT_736051 [Caerostris extrusa]